MPTNFQVRGELGVGWVGRQVGEVGSAGVFFWEKGGEMGVSRSMEGVGLGLGNLGGGVGVVVRLGRCQGVFAVVQIIRSDLYRNKKTQNDHLTLLPAVPNYFTLQTKLLLKSFIRNQKSTIKNGGKCSNRKNSKFKL